MCSLLGLAWLAAGTAAADPPGPLHPLPGVKPAADLRDPPPLVPAAKAALPEMPAVTAPVAAKTLFYQKDAAPAEKPAVRPALYQDPVTGQPSSGPEAAILPPSATNTTPPDIKDIPLQTEASLQQSIVAEVKQYRQSEIFRNFPNDYEALTKVAYAPHALAPAVERVEPTYVCYERLYFEEKNAERYGWELGPLQPFVSAAKFYGDLVSFPYNFGTRPCQRFETSAGYCLPGDPVPYLIYPIELSVTGGLLQAGTVVGLYAIFP